MAQPGETPAILPGKHGPARSCLSSVCPHVFLPELYARPHVSSSFSCASPDKDLSFFFFFLFSDTLFISVLIRLPWIARSRCLISPTSHTVGVCFFFFFFFFLWL